MTNKICSVEGCNNMNYGFGMCRLHFRRFRRTGSTNAKPVTTHGKSKTLTYKVWANMLFRCNNVRAVNYEYYGGKGIKVCERWKSFENFLSDMGEKPTPQHQIDRIDSDKNYEPNNCRWVMPVINIRNRRHTKLNEGDIIKIKSLLKINVAQKIIAKDFNVAPSTITSIKQGRFWQDAQ